MKPARFIAALGLAVVLPIAIRSSGLILNETDSVPLGIYRRIAISSGKDPAQYAGFCLPVATANAALAAGLDASAGGCPAGLAPLLKPLLSASREHPLALTDRGFSVDQRLLPNTAPKLRSRTGAPLAHYPFGVYTSGLWALSTFNPNSFDSRYFGPVAPETIRFYAKPVWTW